MKAIRLGRLVRLQKTGESYKGGVGYKEMERSLEREDLNASFGNALTPSSSFATKSP